jgi:hypothetical protein
MTVTIVETEVEARILKGITMGVKTAAAAIDQIVEATSLSDTRAEPEIMPDISVRRAMLPLQRDRTFVNLPPLEAFEEVALRV